MESFLDILIGPKCAGCGKRNTPYLPGDGEREAGYASFCTSCDEKNKRLNAEARARQYREMRDRHPALAAEKDRQDQARAASYERANAERFFGLR